MLVLHLAVACGEASRSPELLPLCNVYPHSACAVFAPITHPCHFPASLQGTFIGAVTLTGSAVAFGKLHGLLNSKPLNIWGAFSGGPALWSLASCRSQALCEPAMRLQPLPRLLMHSLTVTYPKQARTGTT